MLFSSKWGEYQQVLRLIENRHRMYQNVQWQISDIDNKINELTQKILNNPSNENIETGIEFSLGIPRY